MKPSRQLVAGTARRASWLVPLFAILGCLSSPLSAQRPSEYQIKAAYLYNFGKFVAWPPADRPSSDFDVCILGNDPFGSTLDQTISNATINGKKVAARRIGRAQEAGGCRIAFLAGSEAAHISSDLNTLNKMGILTVSDLPHFLDRGGMIQFVIEDDKVRFEVNLPAAQQAGLTLSSELLKVATRVMGSAETR
jgi:hypothetical protein